MTEPSPDRLAPQSWMHSPEIRRIITALTEEGEEVRFVGGCVRDALAGRPIKDIDLATPLRPDRVVERLERAGLRVVPTGLSHGTVTAVVGTHKENIEITTLRVDRRTDGRRAEVDFTEDWTADAARRDFTMNAISLTPDGRIHDPFGGAEDLAKGRVRFVGDARKRIKEDYLRLLRFFRFHAYYGSGPMDRDALAAAHELAPGLKRLSAERVRDELLRLLAAPDPVACLETMVETAVLAQALPEAGSLRALGSLLRLERGTDAAGDPLLRLSALLAVGQKTVASAGTRLKLSTRDIRGLSLHDTLADSLGEAVPDATLTRLLHGHGSATVMRAQLLAWSRRDEPPPAAERRERMRHIEDWRMVAFPLSGKDLVAEGIAPGPEMGDLLRDIEEWWLDEGRRPDRAACLERLRERLGERGGPPGAE
jgi:poly(A) polymerase